MSESPEKRGLSPFRVEYEMGYRDDEFGTVLQGPFSGEKSPYQCRQLVPNHWQIAQSGENFDLDIQVTTQPPRILGLFNLPVLKVEFLFTDTDEALRDRFFHRFHQYFQKGGG